MNGEPVEVEVDTTDYSTHLARIFYHPSTTLQTLRKQLQVPVRTAKWCQCDARRTAESTRPATGIVRTKRNSVVCTFNSVCVCVGGGDSYLHHHKVVATKGSRDVHRVTSGKKAGTAALITCSNAAGNFLSSYCLCKGNRKKNEFEDGMPSGSIATANETTGYVTTVVFLD